jgi:hypothetical protein
LYTKGSRQEPAGSATAGALPRALFAWLDRMLDLIPGPV